MDNPVRESEDTKVAPKSIAGRFKIVRELGRGGAGIVYEGVQLSVDRRVAVKVLHADHQAKEDHVERFEREAKAIARLSHTNCITLFDFGFSEEFSANYMVMEYIEGEELFAITRARKLPINIALRIAIQLSEAIAHAHKHGILHRDLKPENVLVTTDWEVKVLDFGLARLLDLFAADTGGRRLTTEGAIFGTPAYMSPEQCAGDLDVTVRSDIYSLGVVLYELFEGQLPFRAKEVVKILVQQATEEPPPMECTDIPPQVKRLVMQMLAKEPQKRPRTGTQVADTLRAVLINLAEESNELNADVSQEIQRSLLRGIDRTDHSGENIRTTEDGLESRTEPMDSETRGRAATQELSGQKLRDYTLGPLIGRGVHGSVFKGSGPSGDQVAIRVITRQIPDSVRSSGEFVDLVMEVKQLRGETIAAMLDSGFESEVNRFFLVTEMVDGDDLGSICRAGRAPTELAMIVARDVAQALAVAHSAGITHGELRPSNIILAPGADGRPHTKVMDFGVRAIAQGGQLRDDDITPQALRYVAPEQLRGEDPTEAADLYALGVLLYQMLSGHAPFDAKERKELANQILSSSAPALSEYIREVPELLSRLVTQLLDKNPSQRPKDAKEVLTRLEAVSVLLPIREVRVDHRGKARDIATAWRLRRSVHPPAPGGKSVTQRSTSSQAAIVIDDEEIVMPKSRTGLVIFVLLLLIAAAVGVYVFGGFMPS